MAVLLSDRVMPRIGLLVLSSLSSFLLSCTDDPPKAIIDASLPPDAGFPDAQVIDTGVRTDPITPTLGTATTEARNCTGAYPLPEELTGPDGLGHFGWTLDDIKLWIAWQLPNHFVTPWISDNRDRQPSLRVRPWLVPEAGYCYKNGLITTSLAELLVSVSPFSHREQAYDGLAAERYTPPTYDLAGGASLVRALHGLSNLANDYPDAPLAPTWDETKTDNLVQQVADYPEPLQQALATLVLRIGEAYQLKTVALVGDRATYQRIYQQFFTERYTGIENAFVSPAGGTVVEDMLSTTQFDLSALEHAAQAVAAAAEDCAQILSDTPPFDAPDIDIQTPHGRVLIRTRDTNDTYTKEDLEGVALLVDRAGDDQYNGRYASTHQFWMSAAVLIDVSGTDHYGPDHADLADPATRAADAFDKSHGFTQGAGLFGVGLLLDHGGDDTYSASVYAQGVGVYGVGLLSDREGTDRYQVGYFGQGAGNFGIGAVIDADGNDHFAVYTAGAGVGKPGGHGLLLDLAGDDEYLCYYNDDPPELPSPGFNNYYNLPNSWAYNDGNEAHYMSVCQGVGWGYRGDWFAQNANWMGGFGALIDLGDGNDQHYADTMSMGQGFVYGFGFLYDEGGDDRYRTFWWGPGAAAHMGVGLFIEEDGNDDMYVTRASGSWGFDGGVGWVIDNGGDDTYGGQVHYGESFTYGLSFFINNGGDDIYNADNARNDALFGAVRKGLLNTNLVGLFLDLGGGQDTYNQAISGVANDATWYTEPRGADVDPAIHHGIGIDR